MTPEFQAYKTQLRLVGLPLRLAGLLVLVVGCFLLIVARYAAMPALITVGLAALGLGWGLVGYTVWLRTQWAKQNPFEGPR